MALTKLKNTEIDLDAIYPVGAVYISVSSTDPGTLFGGTWAAFAAGRAIVGLDGGQTEFDTAEETGGAKTHTLTTGEIPAHTHSASGAGSNMYNDTLTIANAGGVSRNVVSVTAAASNQNATIGSAGGGGAHNNLQPYIVVYMWKRTA